MSLAPDLMAVGYDDRYDPDTHVDRWYTDATARVLAPTMRRGDRVLELGSATGRMTAAFDAVGAHVVGIERSPRYIARAAARELDQAEFVCADVGEWLSGAAATSPSPQFDHVIATNIVHELPDLPAVLVDCHKLLRPEGTLHLTVQNPRSIHRLTGRALGVIDDLASITDQGRDLLTLRIHDADELAAALGRAGFATVDRRGIMLKPFPNHEMAQLTDEQMEGLIAVGAAFPDHCAMNHIVARPS